MAEQKLVGQNYSTSDLRAKVTGRARYAEDFRAVTPCWSTRIERPAPSVCIDASITPRLRGLWRRALAGSGVMPASASDTTVTVGAAGVGASGWRAGDRRAAR